MLLQILLLYNLEIYLVVWKAVFVHYYPTSVQIPRSHIPLTLQNTKLRMIVVDYLKYINDEFVIYKTILIRNDFIDQQCNLKNSYV